MQHTPALVLRVDRLKELCASAGINSMPELAKRINVAPSTLWRVENGLQEPSSRLIARLKLAFPLVALDDLVAVAA